MPSQGGQPGMMGGGMDQIMPMMRAMMADRDGMMFEHVEDRLAALRTELKITDAQMPQLRLAAKTMDGVHQRMVQEQPRGQGSRHARESTICVEPVATQHQVR
jgi:hypothetical protein